MKKMIILASITLSATFSMANTQRVENCYNQFHQLAQGPIGGTTTFEDIIVIEVGREFLKCQEQQEGKLEKQNSNQSSGIIIEQLGSALRQDLNNFYASFEQLVK